MSEYTMLKPGSKVAISLAVLYSRIGGKRGKATTAAGHVIVKSIENDEDDSSDYYDLDNGETAYACCDGEECTVVREESGMFVFRNDNQDKPQEFKLSKAECEQAIFGLH